jgi:hypothetical protein
VDDVVPQVLAAPVAAHRLEVPGDDGVDRRVAGGVRPATRSTFGVDAGERPVRGEVDPGLGDRPARRRR